MKHQIAAIGTLIFGCYATAGVSRAASPNVILFEGICNASASVALDGSRIVVGDDEVSWLSVYDIAGGAIQKKIPLPIQSTGQGDGDDPPEADIEAATVLGNQIVWISSHGRNAKGKVREDRWQLFSSHQLAADGMTWNVLFSPSYRGLLHTILATKLDGYGALKTAIGNLNERVPELAPKKRGLNIEGMAASPDGKSLLIGLRNPMKDGKALLVPIQNPFELLGTGNAVASLGQVRELDLGGRGIRDIAWSPAHQEYLIIGGQADDSVPGPGFAVFRWTGQQNAEPRLMSAFDDLRQIPNFQPEAIVPLRDPASGQFSKDVLLISDDGTRPMPQGGVCKDVSDDAKAFRAIKVLVP